MMKENIIPLVPRNHGIKVSLTYAIAEMKKRNTSGYAIAEMP